MLGNEGQAGTAIGIGEGKSLKAGQVAWGASRASLSHTEGLRCLCWGSTGTEKHVEEETAGVRYLLGLMTSHHKCSNLLGPISPVLELQDPLSPLPASWELSQGAMTQGLSHPGESHICNPLSKNDCLNGHLWLAQSPQSSRLHPCFLGHLSMLKHHSLLPWECHTVPMCLLYMKP